MTKEILPNIFRDGCQYEINNLLSRDQKLFENLVKEAIEIERDLKTNERHTFAVTNY